MRDVGRARALGRTPVGRSALGGLVQVRGWPRVHSFARPERYRGARNRTGSIPFWRGLG